MLLETSSSNQDHVKFVQWKVQLALNTIIIWLHLQIEPACYSINNIT